MNITKTYDMSLDVGRGYVTGGEINDYLENIKEGEKWLDGFHMAENCTSSVVKKINKTGKEIREKSEVVVVLGVGAIYLGARAGIAMLGEKYGAENAPEIIFAGWNSNGTYHKSIMESIKDKETCVIAMAKNNLAPETEVVFSAIKQEMIKKYGREAASERIYTVCGLKDGDLALQAKREGYTTYYFSEDISTAYSILTAAGLLPLAVRGVNIEEVLTGACVHREPEREFVPMSGFDSGYFLASEPELIKDIRSYIASRFCLQNKGKKIEVFEYYDPKLAYFVEWVKHLFAGSEGKDGKGIYPTSLQFSNDLLDMGQFIQHGNQVFFETVFDIEDSSPGEEDTMVKDMDNLNKTLMIGIMQSHRTAGIPVLRVKIPMLTPYYFGQMAYFFTRTAAISSHIAGADPFEHPALEIFKEKTNQKSAAAYI